MYLYDALLNYAGTSTEFKMINEFLNLKNQQSCDLSFALHERVTILGKGRFVGYHDFKIVANRLYGDKQKRERFDYIEIHIPKFGMCIYR